MPSPVDRYFDEVKQGNPEYTDEQAWATAWSIYCRHKNPGSEHCHQPTSEYLSGREAGLLVHVAARYLEAERMDAVTLQAFKWVSVERRKVISRYMTPMSHELKALAGEAADKFPDANWFLINNQLLVAERPLHG